MQPDAPPKTETRQESAAGPPRWVWLGVAMLALGLVAVIVGVVVAQARRDDEAAAQLAARQADIERRGASVMPFDQNRTTHRFVANDRGGVQTVTANDPADATQIGLVRSHLEAERKAFATGNFDDPATIHGHQMAGLAELQQGAASGRLTVTYQELPDGARLTYTTDDAALVDAVHRWFDAQLTDHGPHATN